MRSTKTLNKNLRRFWMVILRYVVNVCPYVCMSFAEPVSFTGYFLFAGALSGHGHVKSWQADSKHATSLANKLRLNVI